MSLSERELRCLDDLADMLAKEDPALARELTSEPRMRRRHHSFRRWGRWPILAVAVAAVACIVIGAAVMVPAVSSTGVALLLLDCVVAALYRTSVTHDGDVRF